MGGTFHQHMGMRGSSSSEGTGRGGYGRIRVEEDMVGGNEDGRVKQTAHHGLSNSSKNLPNAPWIVEFLQPHHGLCEVQQLDVHHSPNARSRSPRSPGSGCLVRISSPASRSCSRRRISGSSTRRRRSSMIRRVFEKKMIPCPQFCVYVTILAGWRLRIC